MSGEQHATAHFPGGPSKNSLTVDGEGLAHGGLDVQPLHLRRHLEELRILYMLAHVVPVLLQQRDQEVDRHEAILPHQLSFCIFSKDLSSSGVMETLPTATPMQSTFFSWNFTSKMRSKPGNPCPHLASDLVHLGLQVVRVLHQRRELPGLRKERLEQRETRGLVKSGAQQSRNLRDQYLATMYISHFLRRL